MSLGIQSCNHTRMFTHAHHPQKSERIAIHVAGVAIMRHRRSMCPSTPDTGTSLRNQRTPLLTQACTAR